MIKCWILTNPDGEPIDDGLMARLYVYPNHGEVGSNAIMMSALVSLNKAGVDANLQDANIVPVAALSDLVEAVKAAIIVMEGAIPADSEFMQKHSPLTSRILNESAARLRAALSALTGEVGDEC